MPKKTPSKKKKSLTEEEEAEAEEPEQEQEQEKEEPKQNLEEKEAEEESKETETPKKKKKKKLKKIKKEEIASKEENKEEIKEESAPKEDEIKDEEQKEIKTKKSNKKKKKKKKSLDKEKIDNEENKEDEDIKEDNINNINNEDINKDEKDINNNKDKVNEENIINNIEENNKENIDNKEVQENEVKKEEENLEDNKDNDIKENNIIEDKKEENNINEEKEEKIDDDIKEEKIDDDIKEEKIEKEEKLDEDEVEEEIKKKNKKEKVINQKESKKSQKNKEKSKPSKTKSKKAKKKEIVEEEEEEQEENEEEGEEYEEQETSPTERKKQKKKKQITSQPYHYNDKFEKEIIEASKKLSKISKYTGEKVEEDENEEEEEENEEEEMTEDKINLGIIYCEKKLRSALNICKNDPYMIINANITEKMTKISSHERENLNYILCLIYISLMNKETLFDYEDEKNFELEDLLIFISDAIQLREQASQSKINHEYETTLKNFLYKISEEVDLEDEDLIKEVKNILKEPNQKNNFNLIFKSFKQLIDSMSEKLESQTDIYEQYQIFIQNKKSIINLIEEADPEESSLHNEYLKLGKFLAFMLFNKRMNIFLKKNEIIESEEEEEEEDFGETLLLYNGKKNKGEMDIINGEKFNIEMSDSTIDMRYKMVDIIIKYCEQFIDIIDIFQIQYIIFILISRLYTCKYEKYKKKINSLLADSVINMCFFEESPIKLIQTFINKILESERPEDADLKKLLNKKIEEVKDEEGFLYGKTEKKNKKNKKLEEIKEEEEKEIDDLVQKKTEKNVEDIISDENLFLLHNDLKLGFVNQKIIKSREKFVFYENLSNNYSLLDFFFDLEDLDIKITITDLTENKEIYHKEKLSNEETPIKIVMFFTKPRILKFEFDNTYSWLRSKNILFKTNIFYPEYPSMINKQILQDKYIRNIISIKNSKKNKKISEDDADKLLIAKLDGKNLVFNCLTVQKNLEVINQMMKNKFIKIISIYIKIKDEQNKADKSYFYCHKENGELLENELTQENFENHLNELITKDPSDLTLINLYIINEETTNKADYSKYSLLDLLGFEPKLQSQDILFFIQNLKLSEILYSLYRMISNGEFIDIVILMTYNKFEGYKTILFDNEEIIQSVNEFKGLSKESNLEENIKILGDGIKKMNFGEERKILIILSNSFDIKESEIIPEKISKLLEENLGKENLENVNIVKSGNEFIKEMNNYSHVFYLDN